jgi:hypothetical protein
MSPDILGVPRGPPGEAPSRTSEYVSFIQPLNICLDEGLLIRMTTSNWGAVGVKRR